MSVLQPQFESAYAIQGTITDIVLAYFKTGNKVAIKADFDQPAGANLSLTPKLFTILGVSQKTFDLAGVSYYQSKLPTVAATCAGYPYALPEDQLNDTTTPIFYVVQDDISRKVYPFIHESDCLPNGIAQEYIKNNIDAWWQWINAP